MPIDPTAAGAVGKSVRRSWKSKDALLYALGVGAGVDELAFTTENTKDLPQRVLPTFAVIIGGGGVPFDRIGTFNPALMLHGAQKIELFDEIPPEGEIESTGHIGAIWDNFILIYSGVALVLLFSIIPPLLITEPRDLSDSEEEISDGPKQDSLLGILRSIRPLWGFLAYDIYAMGRRVAGVEPDNWYDNGNYHTLVMYDGNHAPMVQFTVVRNCPHTYTAEMAQLTWDTFLCHFTREPDGTVKYHG